MTVEQLESQLETMPKDAEIIIVAADDNEQDVMMHPHAVGKSEDGKSVYIY